MKTSTVNGVTYELPEGWEPIETVPMDNAVNVLLQSGRFTYLTFCTTDGNPFPYIAWQHIVAPKVMPWRPKEGEPFYVLWASGKMGCLIWYGSPDDQEYYESNNCYPTQAAAEAARERVIAAHTGGAKWKGGV